VAKPAQSQLLELANPLASQIELVANLLEGPRYSVIEPVPQSENSALPFGQSLDRHPQTLRNVHLLGDLYRVGRLFVLDEVAELCAILADGLLQRDGVGDTEREFDLVDRDTGLFGDFIRLRITPEFRFETGLRGPHCGESVVQVNGDPNGSRLVGDRARDRLANPPRGVGGELEALAPIELLDSPDQTEVSFLNEVEEVDTGRVCISPGIGDDQPQVRCEKRILGFAPKALLATQLDLFLLGVESALFELLCGVLAAFDLLGELNLLFRGQQVVFADRGQILTDEISCQSASFICELAATFPSSAVRSRLAVGTRLVGRCHWGAVLRRSGSARWGPHTHAVHYDTDPVSCEPPFSTPVSTPADDKVFPDDNGGMPANLTPDYKSAEAAYRRSRDPEERLAALREMFRTVPKHKGTEHLRADIKTRIKELTEELSGPRKGGARGGPPTVIRPDGAAQVAMLGPPNSGKSLLHECLTGSHTQSGPYPFTTQYPHPGMLPYEDIAFQLVDLPPVAADHPIPWLANAVQPADASLLVVDVSTAGCVERVEELHATLASRKITLTGGKAGADVDDPFAITLPTLLVATKADRAARCMESAQALEELLGLDYPAVAVSSTERTGLEHIGQWLFDRLGVVRVYTKVPGKPPDVHRPYTIRKGDTVEDVATMVHKDLARTLKFARIWGSATFDGQQVGREHQLVDRDVVELHG